MKQHTSHPLCLAGTAMAQRLDPGQSFTALTSTPTPHSLSNREPKRIQNQPARTGTPGLDTTACALLALVAVLALGEVCCSEPWRNSVWTLPVHRDAAKADLVDGTLCRAVPCPLTLEGKPQQHFQGACRFWVLFFFLEI